MTEFPKLQSGSVAQYPLARGHAYETHVVRFLDGSEQRHALGKRRREWTVVLDGLSEEETAVLLDFVDAVRGRGATFAFTDPQSGRRHERCRLGEDRTVWDWDARGRVSGRLMVIEEGV